LAFSFWSPNLQIWHSASGVQTFRFGIQLLESKPSDLAPSNLVTSKSKGLDSKKELRPNLLDSKKELRPNLLDSKKELRPNLLDSKKELRPNLKVWIPKKSYVQI
jgi:hypothetical protein